MSNHNSAALHVNHFNGTFRTRDGSRFQGLITRRDGHWVVFVHLGSPGGSHPTLWPHIRCIGGGLHSIHLPVCAWFPTSLSVAGYIEKVLSSLSSNRQDPKREPGFNKSIEQRAS